MNIFITARRSLLYGAAVVLLAGSYAFAAAHPARRQTEAKRTAKVRQTTQVKPKTAVKPTVSDSGLKPTQHPNVWVRFAPQPRTSGSSAASIYVMPGTSIPAEGISPVTRTGLKAVTRPTVQTLPNGAKYVLTLPEEVNYATATIDPSGKVVVSCGTPTKPKETLKGAAK